jgi:hypothetical protein
MNTPIPVPTVLVLRTSDKNCRSYGEFQWPSAGLVEAPDWLPAAACGGGLHGLLKGVGDVSHLKHNNPSRVWQVVEVAVADIVDIEGDKVKFPRGVVVYSGNRDEAVAMIQARHPEAACVFASATAGTRGIATAGEWGTATAGYAGIATAGERGTATAGERGTATAGYAGTATAGTRGIATAGEWGTATAGYAGTATAGEWGTATAGYAGTATAGERGIATAGEWGTATAGEWGIATAGEWGTATAGEWGEIRIRWYDGKRYRTAIGYIGEDGLLACKAYTLDGKKFVEKS